MVTDDQNSPLRKFSIYVSDLRNEDIRKKEKEKTFHSALVYKKKKKKHFIYSDKQ